MFIFGVGAVAFLLEACYGTPSSDFIDDLQVRKQSRSEDTLNLSKPGVDSFLNMEKNEKEDH